MRYVALLLGLIAVPVTFAQASPYEFCWVPSGTIAIGDAESEAAAGYTAVGDTTTVQLAYRNGPELRRTGRRVVGDERFTIRPASYRLGPAPAHLVLARTVDTGDVPGPLTVLVGDKEVGTWKITPPAGSRRLHDALFVIARSVFPDERPPAEVHVTIRSDEPALSLGYRFYATDDWDTLSADQAGDIAAAAEDTSHDYLAGLVAFGDHDWTKAQVIFSGRHGDYGPHLERMARFMRRWIRVKQACQDARNENRFETHYRLGLLAGAWGCWEDAHMEFARAVEINSRHADATYRLAEAMEYCRMPIDTWAPLMERAGQLGETDDVNIEDVLVAIHTDPVEGLCGQLSQKSLDCIVRDWRRVEQQVYGASGGAWKLRTQFKVCGSAKGLDPATLPVPSNTACKPWVMQAGWIFLPPDEAVPDRTYDYSIGTAEYGSSHAGGSDCGVSGAGGSQIGAQRNWEVFLHEWNHQFDWIGLFGETTPGYPVTHDSDGCGKQPIVNMGCGHRSSMRYYVTPAQYRRHEGADPLVPGTFVDTWWIMQPEPIVELPDDSIAEIRKWLLENDRVQPAYFDQLEQSYKNLKAAEQKPKPVPPQPRKTLPTSLDDFIRQSWYQMKMIDEVQLAGEPDFVAGRSATMSGAAHEIAGDFVDLLTACPTPHKKAYTYARTFVYSPRRQEARLWLGYNDCAQLWLNGRRIHDGVYYACAKWEDLNRPAMLAKAGVLQEGWNCIALKVERGGGDWGFSIHIVDVDNQALPGLKIRSILPAGETCNTYTPPTAGKHYDWAVVQDDWLEKLPRLTTDDLEQITNLEGLQRTPHRFHITMSNNVELLPGSRYTAKVDDGNRQLDNYLNWDCEAAAAIRYVRRGQMRDLLLVRPEYIAEFVTLLKEVAPVDTPITQRLLGYLYVPTPQYATVPNRSPRAVLVFDAHLPDYPMDDLDLLSP